MPLAAVFARLKRSPAASAGTIVFGMEDGTVSIFGLVFGVAATTTSSAAVLIAGASGAAAAAVSMMAGAYLDAEKSRDEAGASNAPLAADLARDPSAIAATLSDRLAAAGLMPGLSAALMGAVQRDHDACRGLLMALQAPPADAAMNPRAQAGSVDAACRFPARFDPHSTFCAAAHPAEQNRLRHHHHCVTGRAWRRARPDRRTRRGGNRLDRHRRCTGWRRDRNADRPQLQRLIWSGRRRGTRQ